MCGIAGILTDAHVDVSARLEAVMFAMRHRGPDDSGHVRCGVGDDIGGTWLFGHRRLSVIDLSTAGRQPMVDARNGNQIVFNGEIYNFQDLRAQLVAEGFEFRSKTDTEVVLLGYARWGTDVVTHLRGMFAFAIFDAATGRVMLARDRLGEKPLYYCCKPAVPGVRFVFASEVRALLAGEIVPRRVDRAGLQTYLTNGFVVGPGTLVEGVRLLEPGMMLLVDCEGACRSRRFWQIPLERRVRCEDNGRAMVALEEVLSDSVRRQLVSDVPLGAFLSGGIDSSVVVGLAQEHVSQPLRTFTLVFEEDAYNEAEYARIVARTFGSDHQEVVLTRSEFQRSLPAALDALDQPSFDGANTFFVSRAARELGLTVALAGTGGDEVFGGYASFSQLGKAKLIRGWASILPSSLRRRLKRTALWADGWRRGGYPSQTATGKAITLLDAPGDLVTLYQTLYRIFLSETVVDLLEDYDHALTPEGLDADLHEWLIGQTAGRTDLAALSLLEMRTYLGQRLLRDTDSVSMAVSLEIRLPLIDYKVIEAASRLDERSRYSPVGSKRCLIKASRLQLPREIVGRKKSGFVLPIELWLRDTLRRETADVLLDPQLCRRVGLRPESVARLWTQFLQNDSGLYWTRVWAIYVLLRWCDRHHLTLAS